MFSSFKHIKNSKVVEEIDVYEFLYSIENPEENIKNRIISARDFHTQGDKEMYNNIKSLLPCFTLNFSFSNKRTNATIKNPSGFIFIDIDGVTDIKLQNPLIFASWISLSGTGRGVLVKVDGLTLSNFSKTYLDISQSLGIDSDKRANKATQPCIHSYDPNIHVNDDSDTWKAETITDKRRHSVILFKEKKVTTECHVFNNIRYDNIDDIEFNNKDYIFFPDDKQKIAKAWIPNNIPVGSRNQVIYSIAYQFRCLNRHISFKELYNFIAAINSSRCEEPLKKEELLEILKKIEKLENKELIKNKERRIIFNPQSKLTTNEKLKISAKLNGDRKSAKTQKKINDIVQNWDEEKDGKRTQKKIADNAGLSLRTVQRHLKSLKNN